MARAGCCGSWTPHNNRMNATRDTNHVIERDLAGGRVMRGVRVLGLIKPMTETCGRQRRAALSQSGGPLSPAGAALRIIISGAWREARGSEYRGWREACAVSATHPNKPMHPTADTTAVKIINLAGRRVIGGVRCSHTA